MGVPVGFAPSEPRDEWYRASAKHWAMNVSDQVRTCEIAVTKKNGWPRLQNVFDDGPGPSASAR